jgi:hypothetical protein
VSNLRLDKQATKRPTKIESRLLYSSLSYTNHKKGWWSSINGNGDIPLPNDNDRAVAVSVREVLFEKVKTFGLV